ncbi:hypothetical protein Bbelb_243390 [Branchiostoma belcheri]|nr:hypothetical protein Bbelb_243390 [Branchiostoma belcheri]
MQPPGWQREPAPFIPRPFYPFHGPTPPFNGYDDTNPNCFPEMLNGPPPWFHPQRFQGYPSAPWRPYYDNVRFYFVGDEDLLEIIGNSENVARLQKHFKKMFADERFVGVSRFYFVGDEDLLEIIGNSKNVARLQKHFKKMFAGVDSIVLNEDATLVKTKTTESKKKFRFYFVGDEDLLEIIGNSKNVARLQKHFKKMFAGVDSIVLNEDATLVKTKTTESKKKFRFYFVGDEDLLEIIGNSENVARLQKHFKKMFAGVDSIVLRTEGKSLLIGDSNPHRRDQQPTPVGSKLYPVGVESQPAPRPHAIILMNTP